MPPVLIMLIEFNLSLLACALIARWYLVPALARRDFVAAMTPLLLLHSFRHLGLMYVLPAAVPHPPPPEFALPTAYGDLLAAVAALIALLAVRRRSALGRPLVWLFNVVGFVDLAVASLTAMRVELVIRYELGVAYLLPVLVVPALIVTHGIIFWLLLRKEPLPPTRSEQAQ